MNVLRPAKYATLAAYSTIWIFVGLVIAGPAAGFLTQRMGPQRIIGVGVDLSQISPQLQPIFADRANLAGEHEIIVPVHNNWFFPASASLSLSIIADGNIVYRTPLSTLGLEPFRSGDLQVDFALSPALLSQIQGKELVVGGEMSLGAPSQLFTFTLEFPQR